MSQPSRPHARRSWPVLFRVVAGIAVLVLLGVGIGFWRQQRSAGDEGAFRTAMVERGNIRVAISSTGTLSATSTVTVGSQISGQVTEILVDFNDRVTQGQVLARIDPILAVPIHLTDEEIRHLVDFVRVGLLDQRAMPDSLKKLIPRELPSGFPVLQFQ